MTDDDKDFVVNGVDWKPACERMAASLRTEAAEPVTVMEVDPPRTWDEACQRWADELNGTTAVTDPPEALHARNYGPGGHELFDLGMTEQQRKEDQANFVAWLEDGGASTSHD